MRLAVLTKTSPSGGGASRFAFELGNALRQERHDVSIFTFFAREGDKGFQQILPKTLLRRFQRHLDWRLARLGFIGMTGWDFQELLDHGLSTFDLLHVHDTYETVSPLLLRRIASIKPVVHTMHDTSSFTGGCINPLGCDKYLRRCGGCPQRSSLGLFDLTAAKISLRRQVYNCEHISCAFPSRWIMNEANAALNLGARARHIPNGFSADGYNYRTKAEARGLLGIPESSFVVSVGAHTVASPHKGFSYAVEALRNCRSYYPKVLLLGNAAPSAIEALQGLSVIAPGFLKKKDELALHYSASDVMLFPSLGDNLPIMVQESMRAGTPVLAFATGGIPEIIDDNENGWLVPRGDGAAFTAKLMALLSTPNEWSGFGDRARAKIERSFSMPECVQRYTDLYRRVVSA